jgi:hypothetical protein
MGGARPQLRRLARLPRDENGGVQSLSFVLTLPVFVMLLMLMVQISQVMIAAIVVHYAAFAAARSAIVWIPANVGDPETENRISELAPLGAGDDPHEVRYRIRPQGPKYVQIRRAAVLACMPLAPSREVGYALSPTDGETALALATAYAGLSAESQKNSRIATRLANKLAYSAANTEIVIEILHRVGPPGEWSDPPLGIAYDVPQDRNQFYPNEVGWRDPITVTVTHHLALLPGPGRVLARAASRNDEISAGIDRRGQVYVWPITASATLGNEGDKPLRSYRQIP